MSAFAAALAAVHADTNIGTPTDFRRPPGPWVPARVVLSRPTDTIGGLGGLSTRASSLAAIVPNAKAIGMDPGQRDGLGQHGIGFQGDGADSAFYLAQF